MLPVLNQKVKVRWNGNNKNYFENLGYIYTNMNDEFEVDVFHLPKSSSCLVWMECDYCKNIIQKPYRNIRDPKKCCCNDNCRKKLDRNRIMIKCIICGTEVERTPSQITKSKNHFCSYECSNKLSRKDNNKWIQLECEYCKGKYEVLKSQYEKFGSRFCSVPCRNKWESKNKCGKNHHNFRAELISCTYCGEKIYRNQAKLKSQSNHFCNTECRRKWYSEIWSQSPEWKDESKKRAVQMLSDGSFKKTDTECQKIVNTLLNDLKINYKNEYNCIYVSIDNYLIDQHLMIEVMGSFWHIDPRIFNKIEYQIQVDRIKHDKIKRNYIKNNYNIDILYLWEDDIHNNQELCKELIKLYVNNEGKLPNYHSFNFSLLNNEVLLNENIIKAYFEYEIDDIRHLIDIKDLSVKRSKKQLDKWIKFKCDNCGKEKEQLYSHYKQNKSHCCSKKCAFEYRRGKTKEELRKII